jgi:hypothetical protein
LPSALRARPVFPAAHDARDFSIADAARSSRFARFAWIGASALSASTRSASAPTRQASRSNGPDGSAHAASVVGVVDDAAVVVVLVDDDPGISEVVDVVVVARVDDVGGVLDVLVDEPSVADVVVVSATVADVVVVSATAGVGDDVVGPAVLGVDALVELDVDGGSAARSGCGGRVHGECRGICDPRRHGRGFH